MPVVKPVFRTWVCAWLGWKRRRELRKGFEDRRRLRVVGTTRLC
jgi:hypothetical protein